MRSIKFKVWDFQNNRWAIENSARLSMGFEFGVNDYYDIDLKSIRWAFCQFTGLLDKNGKEIYEGDWCWAEFRDRNGIQVIQGQIIMDDYMWCIDCTGCVGDDIFSINRPHNFEVVGNIYENPELLNP